MIKPYKSWFACLKLNLKLKCGKCKREYDLEQFDNEPSVVDGYRTGSDGHYSDAEYRRISCPNCGNQIPVST